tara:strand:+ start:693 stop:926 length:234 start_codon:yes stop_codon:yes gene_type:complete
MDIDKILEQIDQETENSEVGHEAFNRTKNMKKFSQGSIENIVFVDPHGDEEVSTPKDWDAHSTFDEENYGLGYDENS